MITPKYIEIQFNGIPIDTLRGGNAMMTDNMINEVKIAFKKDFKMFFIRKAIDKCLDELGNNGCPSENNVRITNIKYNKERYIYTIQFKVLCENCIPSDYEFLKDEIIAASKSFYYNNMDERYSVSFQVI